NLGTALAMAGRHKEAAERLEHASIARPRDADCQNNLGIALLFTGEHDQAEAAFGRALELRPGWPAALYNSGRAAAAQGKHQQALNSYSRAVNSSKAAPVELMLDMARSFNVLKRHGDALTAYDRALSLEPRS